MSNNMSIFSSSLSDKKRSSAASPAKKLSDAYDPHRDWRELLVVSTILLFVLAALSSFLFWQIQKEDAFRVSDTGGQEMRKIDKAALDRVAKRFEEREAAAAKILKMEDAPIDPSR